MPKGKKKAVSAVADGSAAASTSLKRSAAGTSYEEPSVALEVGLALKEDGNKLFKDGEYMKAIKQYKMGILRTRGLVARTAAMAMFALGRGTEPLSEEQEVELVRLTQSLHANLSACYLKLSEWDKAVRYAAVVLDSDPGNVKSMLRLGQAYNQLGDLVGADRILTKAASLHTRPDALGKALRETLRDVRNKLCGRDSGRSAAHSSSPAAADQHSAGDAADQEGERAADTDAAGGGEGEEWHDSGMDGETEEVASPSAS